MPASRESAEGALWRERFASSVAEILDSSLNLSEKFQQLADAFVPALGELCLIDLLDAGGRIRMQAISSTAEDVASGLGELRSRFPPSVDGDHPVARVLRTGVAETLTLSPESLRPIAQSNEHLGFMVEHGYSGAIVVPLADRDSTLGALSVLRLGDRPAFGPEDLTLVEEVSRRASTALTNARLYERAQAGLVRATFLSEAGAALEATLDYEETLRTVAELAVAQFADWCTVDLVDASGELRNVAVAHRDRELADFAHELQERYPPEVDGRGGRIEVVRTGRSVFYPEISEEMLTTIARDEEHLRLLRKLAMGSAISVPLAGRGETFGVLTLISAEGKASFTDEDHRFAEDLARRAGMAIENARLYAERSHLATTLQHGLLPERLPRVPGMEVAIRYRAARPEQEVGGDFYDLFAGEGGWSVVVGDVCGKGAEAAALTAMVRYTLRAYALEDPRPSQVLRRLNRALLAQSDDARFVTLALLRLTRAGVDRSWSVESALAGHPPLLLLPASGESCTRIEAGGPALGLWRDADFPATTTQMAPGSTLILYSDGLLDSSHAAGLDPDAILELGAPGRVDPERIATHLEQGALRPGEPQRDDIVIAVLRGPGAGAQST